MTQGQVRMKYLENSNTIRETDRDGKEEKEIPEARKPATKSAMEHKTEKHSQSKDGLKLSKEENIVE